MGRNPGIPHFRRIADAVIARLGDKSKPLERVPSERALARKYGVARNTARRALEELRQLGYVTRVQGSGTHTHDAAQETQTVFVFGYHVAKGGFHRLFSWLNHLTAHKGIRLVVRDIGLHGEFVHDVFDADQARQASAVIWFVSSHPLGIHAATLARRKLPRSLPMVCIGHPLGVSIQSRQRIDVVHFDYVGAIRQILQRLERNEMAWPIFVDRSDVTIASWRNAKTTFLGELLQRGIKDAGRYVLYWDIERPESLLDFLRQSPALPRPFILPYLLEQEFHAAWRSLGVDFNSPLIEFDRNDRPMSIGTNYRALAEAIYELLMSRLARPRRPNLDVRVNLPVRW